MHSLRAEEPLKQRLDHMLLSAGFEDEWEDFIREAASWIQLCHKEVAYLMRAIRRELEDYHAYQAMILPDGRIFDGADSPTWFKEAMKLRDEAMARLAAYIDTLRAFMDKHLPVVEDDDDGF